MKKKSKSNLPKVDPYVEGLMAKLLERLTSLERKIDSVVSRVAPQAQVQSQAPRHERMMYEAICADCSKVCEVPFKPSEERKVYCKTCWAARKGGRNSRPGMPVLTPVSLPPKPVGKLAIPAAQALSTKSAAKKTKKSPSAKKAKKKR